MNFAKVTQFSDDSWSPNPWLYVFGRPFPEVHIHKLLGPLLDRVVDPNGIWYEPGAGTGRIIRAVAKNHPSQKMCASEITPEMFRVLDFMCVAENLVNLVRVCSDARSYLPEMPVTLCILSSLLHLLPDWRELLKHLSEISASHSSMLLLGERADIYDLLLGSTVPESDSTLTELCTEYVDLRRIHGIPVVRTSVSGASWTETNNDVVDELAALGYREVNTASVNWIHEFRQEDLTFIISERLYSSMFTAPEVEYLKVAEEWKRRVARRQAILPMWSRHSATARILSKTDTTS